MSVKDTQTIAEHIYQTLRLKTHPLGVAFYGQIPEWPEKTRRPSQTMKKRITICQAVTLARTYRWTVGLTVEDIVCVPAMLAFGHAQAENPQKLLCDFFARVGWSKNEEKAALDVSRMSFMPKGRAKGMLLAPLPKGRYFPS